MELEITGSLSPKKLKKIRQHGQDKNKEIAKHLPFFTTEVPDRTLVPAQEQAMDRSNEEYNKIHLVSHKDPILRKT